MLPLAARTAHATPFAVGQDRNWDGLGRFRIFDFAIFTASPTPSFITSLDMARAKPFTCSPVIVGGGCIVDTAFLSIK